MNLAQFWFFESITEFYVIHALASLVVAFFATIFLKKRFEDHTYSLIGFFFLFNIAVPIAGFFFTAWLIYYLLHVKYEKVLNNISYINMVEFETEFPEIERIFGEGSMSDLLSNGQASSALKMKALVSMADNITQNNVALIKNSLSDKDDEIRLYSFAIIDKMERGINKSIHTKLTELNALDTEDEKRIILAEELAYLYWDMVYFELSDEDLKKFILTEVQKYAKIVLNHNMNHMNINILLGKVYLMLERYEDASTCFAIVIEEEGESSYTYPYLAEIFFNQKNFRSTKALLNSSKNLKINSTLSPIIEQWKSA
ncbi:MAG: hypothetical protein U9N52_03515 [Campylobacterota bacterium]|nr:hypothetical protein [Campylobacterota bacterium]